MNIMQANFLYDGEGLIGLILALGFGMILFAAAIMVVLLITYWRIFEKAGKPGWHSLIPFLNTYDMYDLSWNSTMGWVAIGLSLASSIFSNAAEKDDSEVAVFLSGVVGLAFAVVYIIQAYKLSLSFGYGVGFFIGLLFLTPIFMMILAFGSARYMGPGGVMKTAGFGAPGMPGYGAPAPYGNAPYGDPNMYQPPYGNPNMNQPPYGNPNMNQASSYGAPDAAQNPYGTQGGYVQQPQSNPFENGGNNYNNYN